MNFVKVRRGCWRLDGASLYALVIKDSDYVRNRLKYGWHVYVCDANAEAIVIQRGVYSSRIDAEIKARVLLSNAERQIDNDAMASAP